MQWENFSLHFKQTYDGGYRYLDRCGEFICRAVERFDCMPGEIKPSGGKLEIPEAGIKIDIDSNCIVIGQEICDPDASKYLKLCKGLSEMVHELFQPSAIIRNGFASKSYISFQREEDLLAMTVNLDKQNLDSVARSVGMEPSHRRVDYTFASGSKHLNVILQPVAFERVAVSKHNATIHSSRVEKSRVNRLNQRSDRSSRIPLSYALMLELDLTEDEPPINNDLAEHFQELNRHGEQLKKMFTLR